MRQFPESQLPYLIEKATSSRGVEKDLDWSQSCTVNHAAFC
jgi:hypothetical protein